MQLRGVRRAVVVALALALPVPLGGCAALGLGATPATVEPTALPAGDSWIVVVPGRPTPSVDTAGKATASPTPTASLPPMDPDCATRRTTGQVLVPVAVVPGPGSLAVTWPRYGGDPGYRIAAVPQRLVSGEQPALRWQQVTPGAGCMVKSTITGLTAGDPYVVWLDAPGTGRLVDGTRLPYSGRSGVVYAR